MNNLVKMAKKHTTLSNLRQSITHGFTLIELIIVLSIVAILSATALDRLFWYQGQAEKVAMEYTATMIKSGLWMSAANLMMANRTADIQKLADSNPINLLAQKPENYLGELDNVDTGSVARGNWYYDKINHHVVYVVAQRKNFTPGALGDFSVRYGMQLIYGEIELAHDNKVPYITGVTLVPLSKYSWN